MANGYAWALGARDGRLTCLFEVQEAGPFIWGPLGDRARLADLEVKSVLGGPARPASPTQPGQSASGHPTGVSIAFVSSDGTKLQKAHVGDDSLDDLTPVPDAQYSGVAYHPSGLALAFTVSTDGGQPPRCPTKLAPPGCWDGWTARWSWWRPGACGEPIDLSAVDVSTGDIAPLAFGVQLAAVRTPASTPPPPLPSGIGGGGFG